MSELQIDCILFLKVTSGRQTCLQLVLALLIESAYGRKQPGLESYKVQHIRDTGACLGQFPNSTGSLIRGCLRNNSQVVCRFDDMLLTGLKGLSVVKSRGVKHPAAQKKNWLVSELLSSFLNRYLRF
jgi:hypothetical protein